MDKGWRTGSTWIIQTDYKKASCYGYSLLI